MTTPKTTYTWAPITKSVKQDDGTIIVYGPASDAGIDRDGQRMNQAWLDKAMPMWKAEGGNIREQHDPKRAVGVAVGLTKDGDSGAWMLAAHIVDPVAVKKVEAGVLKGYSIGIKEPKIQLGKADAPNGEVVGGYIIETSLADRPANPRMLFTMAKADGAGGELEAVDNPTLVESPDEGDPQDADGTKVDEPDLVKVVVAVDGELLLKFVSAAQRDKDAKSGVAMANGDFPIPDEGHLKSAIGHLGNYTGDKAAAKRHVISRARALNLSNLLPEDWNVSKADQVLVDLAPYAVGGVLTKYDEAADIAGAEQAMALIARLIASEAAELANGRMEEARDIGILLDAHRALDWFRCREQEQQQMPSGEPDMALTDTPTSPSQGDSTTLPELIKAAVAEAITPFEERAEGLARELATLKTDMAAMPMPGGPVLMKTDTHRAQAQPNENQLRADELLAKADATADLTLAAGYRQRARELSA